MILELKLENTYGTQNNDVAKKNKINKINVPVTTIGDVLEENSASISISISPTDNIAKKMVTSGSGTDFPDTIGTSVQKTSKFPFYIVDVRYKDYTITVNSSDNIFSKIKNIKIIPDANSILNSGERCFLSTTNSGTTGGMTFWAYEDMITDFEQYFMDFDLAGKLDNLETDGAFGTTSWQEKSNFTDGKYTIDEVETDINNQISNFVQDGINAIQKEDNSFSIALNYIKPYITSWKNEGTSITIIVRCPYAIYMMGSENAYQIRSIKSIFSKDAVYDIAFDSADLYKITNTIESLSILVEYQTTVDTVSYYDGDREYTAEESFLFTQGAFKNGSYVYDRAFAEDLYSRYKNGKLMINLKYPIMKTKDILGSSIVYVGNYGIAKEENGIFFGKDGAILNMENYQGYTYDVPLEEDIMCYITRDGKHVFTNADGSPKKFIIRSANIDYKGIGVNDIELIESEQEISKFSVKFSQPEGVTYSVMIKGPNELYYQDLLSGQTIAKGDTIKIAVDTTEDGYGVGSYVFVNGQKIYTEGRGYWLWYVTQDAIIEFVTYKVGEPYLLNITSENNLTVTKSDGTQLSNGDTIYGGNVITLSASLSNAEYALDISINGQTITGEEDTTISYSYTVSGDTTIVSKNKKLPSDWLQVEMPVVDGLGSEYGAWISIAYGNDKFVAISTTTSNHNKSYVATSSDGLTWTPYELTSEKSIYDIAYGNGKFVIVGNGVVFVSTDAITWQSVPISIGYGSIDNIVYGNGKFVAIVDMATVIYSEDGITWTQATLPYNYIVRYTAYGNNIFVITTNAGVFISSDGINWTYYAVSSSGGGIWGPIAYGNNKFSMLVFNGNKSAYSEDGITWTLSGDLPYSANWEDIGYGNGKFVTVSYNSNYAVVSRDAINWFTERLPAVQAWKKVAYGNGKLIAVGYGKYCAILV